MKVKVFYIFLIVMLVLLVAPVHQGQARSACADVNVVANYWDEVTWHVGVENSGSTTADLYRVYLEWYGPIPPTVISESFLYVTGEGDPGPDYPDFWTGYDSTSPLNIYMTLDPLHLPAGQIYEWQAEWKQGMMYNDYRVYLYFHVGGQNCVKTAQYGDW